jgi:hypothetical protein
MPNPVNLLTPDAPDSEDPRKRMVVPKPGSGIRVGPIPVDVRDKDIYTAEKGMPPMPDEGPTEDVRIGKGAKRVKNAKDAKSIKKYAAGGSVSRRADGIAQRGKTNCKMR